ncbi:MAG: hypothetical protein ACRCYU_06215 [Nocardioides sp.]
MNERRLGDVLATRGLSPRWWGSLVAAWLAVAVFARVSLPLKFPFDAQDKMIDSGVVVGLVVPIAVMTQLLDEGSPQLVAGAARRLRRSRWLMAGGYVALAAVGGLVVGLLAPAPRLLVLGDALLLAGLSVFGAGLLGARLAWLVPLSVTMVVSAPGLVPWSANLPYRTESACEVLMIALVVAGAGLATYGRFGAYGVAIEQTIRRADADIVEG